MEIVGMRIGDNLVGVDEFQSDDIRTLPHGKHVLLEIKEDRNPDNHRRYFAFINTAFNMQSIYDNQEHFRKFIQCKAGHYDAIVTPKGKTIYAPKSIQWSKLKEPEFRKLFKECINAFIAFYNENIGHMTDNQFYQIIDFD